MRWPTLDWELIVIDNASTDLTQKVVSSFIGRLPIRCVFEANPGLANARNRAVAESQADYLIFTDDDVLVNAEWLTSYCDAFVRWPSADIFGGPIEPHFEEGPPSWLAGALTQIGPVFGRQSLGDKPVRLRPERVGEGPYGANMAFSRRALSTFQFDPSFGVCQGNYRIGEETQVIRKLLLDGHEAWWSPKPQVLHVIPRRNQTIAYVRRWMVGAGRSMAHPSWTGAERWPASKLRLWLQIIRSVFLFTASRFTRSPSVWVGYVVVASQAWGVLQERRTMRTKYRGGKSPAGVGE